MICNIAYNTNLSNTNRFPEDAVYSNVNLIEMGKLNGQNKTFHKLKS